MSDGSLVAFSESELRQDLEDGTKEAAEKAGEFVLGMHGGMEYERVCVWPDCTLTIN